LDSATPRGVAIDEDARAIVTAAGASKAKGVEAKLKMASRHNAASRNPASSEAMISIFSRMMQFERGISQRLLLNSE
jgi:hypothetical protein